MLAGSLSLPATLQSAKPPIFLRLTPTSLAAVQAPANRAGLLIAEGTSPVLRIGEELLVLEALDDPNPFDIVSYRGGKLSSLGSTVTRYTIWSDLSDASSRLRERTQAAEHERNSHRSLALGPVAVDKRGRSISPSVATRRAISPSDAGSHASAPLSLTRSTARLVAAEPFKRRTKRSHGSEAAIVSEPAAKEAQLTNSTFSNSWSASSTSSNETTSTRLTSVSPPPEGDPLSDKKAMPDTMISAPPQTIPLKVEEARKRPFEHFAASDGEAVSVAEPDLKRSRSGRGPHVRATTASGTRMSQSMRQSSSSSGELTGQYQQRSITPEAVIASGRLNSAHPSSEPRSVDSMSLRAATLASVTVKKRRTSPDGHTPAGSRHNTPVPSRPSTPALSAHKRVRNPRAEIWYSSSEDEGDGPPTKMRQTREKSAARGTLPATKGIANPRMAELVVQEDDVATQDIQPLHPADRLNQRHIPRLEDSAVALVPFAIQSARQFADLASKFHKDLAHYENERKRLVELRADIQIALKLGQETIPREDGLANIGRSDIAESSRRARRRYDELATIKAVLQVWIDSHHVVGSPQS